MTSLRTSIRAAATLAGATATLAATLFGGGCTAAQSSDDARSVSEAVSGASGSDAAVSATTNVGTGPGAMVWFVSQNAINLLSQTAAGATLADEFFDSPSTYVLGSAGDWADTPPPSRAVPALTYTAVHTFTAACGDAGDPTIPGIVDALAAGLPYDAGAILYDDEDWCFTPPSEIDSLDDVRTAEDTAASAVRAAHLGMLAAPGQDIMNAMPGVGGDGSGEDRYVDAGIAKLAAANADVYEIQSQQLQYDQSAFVAFVSAAAAQARAAHSSVRVIAGLSTNPSGGPVTTSGELCTLIAKTRAVVDGYWLNMPVEGKYCPDCGPDAGTDMALELLRMLAAGDCNP